MVHVFGAAPNRFRLSARSRPIISRPRTAGADVHIWWTARGSNSAGRDLARIAGTPSARRPFDEISKQKSLPVARSEYAPTVTSVSRSSIRGVRSHLVLCVGAGDPPLEIKSPSSGSYSGAGALSLRTLRGDLPAVNPGPGLLAPIGGDQIPRHDAEARMP